MGGFLSREESLCSWCGPHHGQLVFTNRQRQRSRRANTSKRAYPRTTRSYTTVPKRRKISSYNDNYNAKKYYNDDTIIEENDTIIENDDTIIEEDDIVIEKDDTLIEEDDIVIENDDTLIEEEADDEDADEYETINIITDNDNNVVEEDVNIQRSDKEIINIVDSNSILLYNRNQNKSSSESDYEEWDDLSESKIMNIIGDSEK